MAHVLLLAFIAMPRPQRPVRRPARFEGVAADEVPVPPKKKKEQSQAQEGISNVRRRCFGIRWG